MSQNITDNGGNPLEMVVPYRRMKGWAIVPWTDESERSTPEQTILPHGQKRVRPQTKRFGIETDFGQTSTKRQAIQSPEDKREQNKPSAKIRVGVRARSKEYNRLEREVQRLKMQNDLLAVAESREIQSLKSEVKRLEDHKIEQNKKIDRLIARTLNQASPSYTNNNLDEAETIRMKEKQIEQQNATIRDLQSSLRSALKLNMLLSNLRDEESFTANIDFAYEMKDIELRVLRTAEFLSNCLYPIDKLAFTIQIHPDLGDMIRKATGSVRTFSSMPGQALRALLFQFIRDQIIYSDMWTALHVEGYMLRAYQKTIERGATSEFLENFHSAALLHMLEHDSEFKTCFLESHVEELQAHITVLLDPLLNPSELEKQEVNFHRELRDLLSTALSFRSRCFPAGAERYEVIQFQPGERFDPSMMEAQLATGNPVSIPEDKRCTIKLCVHGLVVAHEIQENSTGLQKIKQLSQPFQTSKSESIRGATPGKVVTGKAIVILQD